MITGYCKNYTEHLSIRKLDGLQNFKCYSMWYVQWVAIGLYSSEEKFEMQNHLSMSVMYFRKSIKISSASVFNTQLYHFSPLGD
jgi:hypothetical protein